MDSGDLGGYPMSPVGSRRVDFGELAVEVQATVDLHQGEVW